MKGFSARLASFLDDNSTFGKITGSVWLLVITNILFLLCSLPVITAGPAYAAMYHVILKSMRSEDEISPVREFFLGFKGNFRQAVIAWICFFIFAVIAVLDIDIITASETISFMRWPVYMITGAVLILISFIFPVLSAFESSFSQLLRNTFYFAIRNPFRAVIITSVNIVPLILTYMDLQRLPLYAFIWCVCGFSVCASAVSRLLIKDFNRFLPDPVSENEE